MKINFLISTLLVFFFLTINDVYAKKNKILIKINNEIITSLDLLQETKYLISFNSELKNLEKNVVYEIAKKSLIRQKIKELELSNKLDGYNIPSETLNKLILNQFRRININSKIELEKYLKNNNINFRYIEEKIKIQSVWNEFIFAKYSKQLKVDEDKIKKELQGKKFQNEFLLSEILFTVEGNENFNKKYNLIKKTISEKNFSEAALTFSVSNTSINGGKLNWINETSLNKKIKDQINSINIGEYTKPIVIPGGFLILQVNNKRESEVEIDLNASVREISQKKINEQLNQFSNIHFNKAKRNFIINEY